MYMFMYVYVYIYICTHICKRKNAYINLQIISQTEHIHLYIPVITECFNYMYAA